MSIDPATGLPELPEGEVWSVSHPAGDGFSGFPGKGKLQVKLLRVETGTRISVGGVWPRKRSVEVPFERTFEVAREPCKGTHSIAVLNAANRIMRRNAVQQRASALVGMYPPNKLAVAS